MRKFISVLFGAALALGTAHAAVTISLEESAGDVTMDINGSIDMTGVFAVSDIDFRINAFMDPNDLIGVENGFIVLYSGGVTGPDDIGSGMTLNFGSVGVGSDTFTFDPRFGNIGLTTDYQSGSIISASALFANESFASLGVTMGTYVWTLGNGDTITIQAGPVMDPDPVPVPLPALLFATGVSLIGLRKRRSA